MTGITDSLSKISGSAGFKLPGSGTSGGLNNPGISTKLLEPGIKINIPDSGSLKGESGKGISLDSIKLSNELLGGGGEKAGPGSSLDLGLFKTGLLDSLKGNGLELPSLGDLGMGDQLRGLAGGSLPDGALSFLQGALGSGQGREMIGSVLGELLGGKDVSGLLGSFLGGKDVSGLLGSLLGGGKSPVPDPVKPKPPVDPVKPVDPKPPVDPVNPVDPKPPAEPVNPVDPKPPVDPVNPVDQNPPALDLGTSFKKWGVLNPQEQQIITGLLSNTNSLPRALKDRIAHSQTMSDEEKRQIQSLNGKGFITSLYVNGKIPDSLGTNADQREAIKWWNSLNQQQRDAMWKLLVAESAA